MERIPSSHIERCALCDQRMQASCAGCGRAFCRAHLSAGLRTCLGCVDRCSRAGCQLVAKRKCHRCQQLFCVLHRPGSRQRCQACERDYAARLASREDALERRDDVAKWRAYVHLGGFLAITAATGQWVFFLVGLGLAGATALARRRFSPLNRLRTRERRRFLAEKSRGADGQ